MGIDIVTTTLWAELATWKPSALEVIVRAEYWAIRGTSRMGKALTASDRYEDDELEPRCLVDGAKAARDVITFLGRTEPSVLAWKEAAPGPATDADEVAEVIEGAGEYVDKLDPEGLEFLLSTAHALQAGVVIPGDVSAERLRALVDEPPRAAQRSSGPMSSLLAASMDTLWIPVPLTHAWDGPFGTVASAVQLRADLEALPALLKRMPVPPDAPRDVRGAALAVEVLLDALNAAATGCVRMSG